MKSCLRDETNCVIYISDKRIPFNDIRKMTVVFTLGILGIIIFFFYEFYYIWLILGMIAFFCWCDDIYVYNQNSLGPSFAFGLDNRCVYTG